MSFKSKTNSSEIDIMKKAHAKIVSISKMQSIPEDAVLKFLNAKGRFNKVKKGMLRIVHKIY